MPSGCDQTDPNRKGPKMLCVALFRICGNLFLYGYFAEILRKYCLFAEMPWCLAPIYSVWTAYRLYRL